MSVARPPDPGSSRRSLLLLAAAWPLAREASAQGTAIRAHAAKARLDRARTRLDAVQAAHRAWRDLRDAAAQGRQSVSSTQDWSTRHASALDALLKANAAATEAFALLQSRLVANGQAQVQAKEALPAWHATVTRLALAGPADLRGATEATDASLARRRT
ncbi:hypothetical protein, partial [Ramlibacter alkalitolerans]